MALRPASRTLSSLTGIVVMAAVLWLLLNFVYAPSCGRFACSYEPSWIPRAHAASDSCPESIEQATSDAEWAAGRANAIPRTDRKTTGLFYDADGAEHTYTSGERDEAAAAGAVAVLKEVGAPASPIGTYPSASHVEVKAAVAMRHGDVKMGVLVINHPGGPCSGEMGCSAALPLVLPAGAALTVWVAQRARDEVSAVHGRASMTVAAQEPRAWADFGVNRHGWVVSGVPGGSRELPVRVPRRAGAATVHGLLDRITDQTGHVSSVPAPERDAGSPRTLPVEPPFPVRHRARRGGGGAALDRPQPRR